MAFDLAVSNQASEAPAPSGTTVSSRDTRCLIDGLRRWYRLVSGTEEDARPDGSLPCLGVVVGGWGAGKSLLLHVARRTCESLGFPFASARCSTTLERPLGAVVSVLDRLAASSDPAHRVAVLEDLPPAARSVVGRFVPRLFDARETPPDEPDVPALPPPLRRSRLIDMLAQTVLAFARRRPLVIGIDDASGLDEASRDVLAACLRSASRRWATGECLRLLFVLACRPEDLESDEWLGDLAGGGLPLFRVDLRGYSREDILDACESCGRADVPLTEREALHQVSGGSPFAVRWILGHAAGGPLALEGLGPADAGDGWAKLVRREYDRLGERDRALVDTLALAERACSAEDVLLSAAALGDSRAAPLGGLTPQGAGEACTLLEMRGWTARDDAADGSPRWVIAGAGLAAALRSGKPAAEIAAARRRLGRLLLDAASGADPDLRLEALLQLRRSGAEALGVDGGLELVRAAEERGAPALARAVREELLAAAGLDEDLRSMLLRDQADSLEAAGRCHDAIDVLQGLLGGRRSLDPEAAAAIRRSIGAHYGRLGDFAMEARTYLEALEDPARPAGSVEDLRIRARIARLLVARGNREEGRRYAVEVADGLDAAVREHPDSTEIELDLVDVYCSLGEPAPALELAVELHRRARERGDVAAAVRAAERLGRLHVGGGDGEEALAVLGSALELSRRCGSRLLEARVLIELGRCHRSLGRFNDAVERLREGRRALLDLDSREGLDEIYGLTGQLELVLGRPESGLADLAARVRLVTPVRRADESLPGVAAVLPPVYANGEERARALDLLRRPGGKGPAEEWRRRLGDLLLDAGEVEEAGTVYQRDMRSPEVVGDRVRMALALQRLGTWCRLRGEHGQALKFFEKSLERLGPAPDRAIVAGAFVEVGRIVRIDGDFTRSYDYLLRGLRIFLELQDPRGEAAALLALSWFFEDVGRRDLSEEVARNAVVLARSSGDRRSEAEGMRMLAAAASQRNEFGASENLREAAGRLVRSLDLPLAASRLELDAAWDRLRRQEFESGIESARRTIDVARGLGLPDLLEESLHVLGLLEGSVHNRRRNFLRSVNAIRNGLESARRGRRILAVRRLLVSLGHVYQGKGNADLAKSYFAEEDALVGTLLGRVPEAFRDAFREATATHVAAVAEFDAVADRPERAVAAPEATSQSIA